jgi:hypothetical protein
MHTNPKRRPSSVLPVAVLRPGLADKPSTAAEMIERTASYQKPEAPKQTWDEFLDTLPCE